MTDYEIADHIAVEAARIYSRESKENYFVSVGNHCGYDLVSQSGKTRIEVKTDVLAAHTQNACIEFWDVLRDRPSGLLATTANFWVHFIPSDEERVLVGYEFAVSSLRKLCFESGKVRKGVGGTVLLKLIPLREFRLASRRSFRMATEFFDEVMTKTGSVPEAPFGAE